MSVTAKLWMENDCPRKWTRVSATEAERIDWTQQGETQHDAYLVECEIASPRGNVVHLALNHLWLKERLIKGWQIKHVYLVTKFDQEPWIRSRASQPGGLKNFYEENERHAWIEDSI